MVYKVLGWLWLIMISAQLAAQDTVDWHNGVSCIIYSHCTSCHNSNGVAPFPLETYDEVFQRRGLIMENILTGAMPPWPARYPEQAFIGDHSLSEEEIAAIESWVMNGAPEGEALENALPLPDHTAVERFADAELVIELPEFVVPPLSDNDLYKCFVFPMEFEQDVFVKAVEVIPGNPRAVHHVLLYHDSSNIPIQLDNADPAEGYTCFGGIGSNNAQLVGGWAPGGEAQVFPENMGIRIPAKTNFVVQVHYPEYAVGEIDQTHINLEITTEMQRELFVAPVLNHFTSMLNGPLVIPANQVKEFYQLWTVPFSKLTLIGIAPHAHLICTEMEAWAEKPNGERVDLVHTPHWDFDWQKFYAYKRPVILEGGMQVYGRAIYDNTSLNHHNPNDPPRTVTLGEDTDEEMMLFFLTMTAYLPGDENLVFEQGRHTDHFLDCGWALSSSSEVKSNHQISLFPNPVSDRLNIKSDFKIYSLSLYDISGRLVLRSGRDPDSMDLSSLEEGMYHAEIITEQGRLQRIVIKQ